MRTRIGLRSLTLLATAALSMAGMTATAARAADGIDKIDHILVIYMENRSFDNLYGLFPGANGLAQAGDTATQVDKDGKPYQTLPAVMDTNKKPAVADERFPMDLPNKPFDMGKYVSLDEKTGD